MCVVNGRISPLQDNFTSISNKGTAVVDYFITRQDDLSGINHFEVVTMSSLVESLSVHGMDATPSRISDHSLLFIDVYVRDNSTDSSPYSHQSVSEHGRHTAPVQGARSGDRGPSPPPRFKVNNVPTDFMSSEESRIKLLSLISEVEESRHTQQDMNTMYGDIVQCFINEMEQHFPQIKASPNSSRKFRFTKKEWWDDELTDLFKDMHKAEREYLKAKKNQMGVRNLFSVFKTKQNVFDRVLKRKKRNFKRTQCINLEQVNSSDPNSFWDYIKKLGPKKTNKIPWECYSSNGEIIYDSDEVLKKWKEDFESLYTPSLNDVTEEEMRFKESIKTENIEFEKLPCNDPLSINARFEIDEIDKVIGKSKAKKAPGIDGIVYDVLKNETTTVLLTKLFNLRYSSH